MSWRLRSSGMTQSRHIAFESVSGV